MPTGAFTLFQEFPEAEAEKKHDLGADQFIAALTNSAPTASTDSVLTDITEIDYTYCSSRNITTTSSSHSGAVYSLILQDLTLTASGGDVGPFQYVVVYNGTATNDDLFGYVDYGAAVTIYDGESMDIDFPATAVYSKTIT